MADHIAGELALAGIRALSTPKLKSILNTLHVRTHDKNAHPEPGDWEVMSNIEKVLRDREGGKAPSGRQLLEEAFKELFGGSTS